LDFVYCWQWLRRDERALFVSQQMQQLGGWQSVT
jgi:hypothetical protein